ncbi:early nodulin-75-like [Sesbania bispinosa]|nr:early nodulin-75-like [Sesbania bispinosa]
MSPKYTLLVLVFAVLVFVTTSFADEYSKRPSVGKPPKEELSLEVNTNLNPLVEEDKYKPPNKNLPFKPPVKPYPPYGGPKHPSEAENEEEDKP